MGGSSRLGALLVAAVLCCGCASAPPGSTPRPDAPGGGTPSTVATPAPSASGTPDERGTPSGPGARRTALRAPAEAASPRRLAQRLLAAERTSRSRTAGDAEIAQAAFDAQVLYRQLARQESWHRPVAQQLPRWLRTTARAHVDARRDFRGMHSTLSRTLPAWQIVRPAPAADLIRFYRQGERRFGVPWEVLAAVNLVETGFGRIRGTSVAGARGPMQFMPATWDAYGRGDIDDPHDAILAAARYLAANGGGRGRVGEALFAYNRHPAYVRGVQAYAGILRAQPRAFRGLYEWQIVYLSARGDVWLPQGYAERRSVPVRGYVRAHPEHLLGRRTD